MGVKAGYSRTVIRRLLRTQFVAAAFVVLAAGAAVQRVALGPSVEQGRVYTHYNNYVIFRDAFTHLRQGQDLYSLYPDEHWDLYKYSPTFAALMAPFAPLPDAIGLVAWDVLGAAVLFLGLAGLPVGTERSRMAMAWLVALPMLQSMQNSQSNAHVAGLVLLTAVWLERREEMRAGVAIALGFFVKIYGGLAIVLALMHPSRWKTVGWAAVWTILFGLVPLLFVSPWQLASLYRSWGALLANDQAASTGVSAMSVLDSWFGLAPPKTAVAAVGLALTLLPLVRVRAYALLEFRMLVLAALMLWMVAFNHKAEPNTFVIAVAGVAVWYLAGPQSPFRVTMVGLVLLLTCLSTTSIFPTVVRQAVISPYSLRVVPCILVWLAAIVEAWRETGTAISRRSIDVSAFRQPPAHSPSTR
jgi:hypothetical protein